MESTGEFFEFLCFVYLAYFVQLNLIFVPFFVGYSCTPVPESQSL